MILFDFIVTLYFIKNIFNRMKILTEKFEVIELIVIDVLYYFLLIIIKYSIFYTIYF